MATLTLFTDNSINIASEFNANSINTMSTTSLFNSNSINTMHGIVTTPIEFATTVVPGSTAAITFGTTSGSGTTQTFTDSDDGAVLFIGNSPSLVGIDPFAAGPAFSSTTARSRSRPTACRGRPPPKAFTSTAVSSSARRPPTS